MGITDEIRHALKSKVAIQYTSETENPQSIFTCVVCGNEDQLDRPLCLHVRGDGYLCKGCARRYTPEILGALEKTNVFEKGSKDALIIEEVAKKLTNQEWTNIRRSLENLEDLFTDIISGISRGIIEAPTAHIGLLFLAKDIKKPDRKEGENEKDYELRVKSYRISRLQEKLKKEIFDRLLFLEQCFLKLGLPDKIKE